MQTTKVTEEGAFLTIEQAAKRLGLSVDKVYRIHRELPVITIANRLMVPVAALDKWLAAKTEEALNNAGK